MIRYDTIEEFDVNCGLNPEPPGNSNTGYRFEHLTPGHHH